MNSSSRPNFDEFSNVNQSMPMTDDQKTSLIGPSCEHISTEEDGENAFNSGSPNSQRCVNGFVSVSLLFQVMPMRELLKLWMDFKTLYQMCIRTL
jgi:hypothetical protein